VPRLGYRRRCFGPHISTRAGLNRDEYLKRWDCGRSPLTPPYSERRFGMAKGFGFGRNPRTVNAVVSPPQHDAGRWSLRAPRPPTGDADLVLQSKSSYVASEAVSHRRPHGHEIPFKPSTPDAG